MSDEHDNRPVTIKALKEALDERPTRMELKMWLAIAVAANQLLPALTDFSNPAEKATLILLGMIS